MSEYVNRDPEVPAAALWQADDDSLQPALVVRSNATAAPAVRVRGAGDLLELRDDSGEVVYSIDQTGTPSAGGGGAGAVDSVNGETGVVVLTAAEVGAQPADTDLTAIAGLTHANDTILQTASGAWAARTPAQVKATLALAKADVGLSLVDNTADTAKPVSSATLTALNAKAPLASPAFTGTPTGITKAHVGLGSVDNTADTAKPISTFTQTALDAKVGSTSVDTIVTLTQAAYDLLTPDAATLYIVAG